MIRLFFILLLSLASAQVFAEEDVSAPPASLKSPESAPETKPAATDQPPEAEPTSSAEDSDKPASTANEELPAEEDGDEASKEPVAEPVATSEEDPVAAPEDPATPPVPRRWNMIPGESGISFSGLQMGKDFSGIINKFTADIVFDDENLEQSKVVVDIDLLSLDAKDDERNKTVKGEEWLDVKQFPVARFETKSISKTEDGGYIAEATLKIRDISREIKLPFTLAFSKVEKGPDKGKDRAVMTGKVVLDRSNFQLGQGEWEDPGIITNEIPVEVKVTAIAADAAANKAPPATP